MRADINSRQFVERIRICCDDLPNRRPGRRGNDQVVGSPWPFGELHNCKESGVLGCDRKSYGTIGIEETA